MRKISKSGFIAVILCLLLSLVLCACSGKNNTNTNPNGKNKNSSDEGKGQQTQDGFEEISSINKQEMFSQFLLGFTEVAYGLSYDTLYTKKQVTADAKATVKLNGSKFWLSIKGKYDCTDAKKIRDKAILAVELSNAETVTNASRLISVFLYRDELYVAIGENKVKFSVKDVAWTDYFPFKMQNLDAASMSSVSGMLANSVVFVSEPRGQQRTNSSKKEYKYWLNIDLYQTMKSLLRELANLPVITDDQLAEIKAFIASVLGVSEEQFDSGEGLANSTLELYYYIFGKEIKELSAETTLSLADSAQKLVGSDTMNIQLTIDDVTLTNQYGQGLTIDFVNQERERETYVKYSDAIYMLSVPIKLYTANSTTPDHYKFNVTTRIFQNDPDDNFVFLEYYDTQTRRVTKAFYVYNNVAYFAVRKDNILTCIYRMDMDLSNVASRVVSNDLEGDDEVDVYALLGYIMKSFNINEREIDVAINKEFFESVVYNFEDLIEYIDDTTGNEMLRNEEVVEFIDFFTGNEVILNILYSDPDLMNICDEDDDEIESIIDEIEELDEQFDRVLKEMENEPESDPESDLQEGEGGEEE